MQTRATAGGGRQRKNDPHPRDIQRISYLIHFELAGAVILLNGDLRL
jgi:hypothetical protein